MLTPSHVTPFDLSLAADVQVEWPLLHKSSEMVLWLLWNVLVHILSGRCYAFSSSFHCAYADTEVYGDLGSAGLKLSHRPHTTASLIRVNITF